MRAENEVILSCPHSSFCTSLVTTAKNRLRRQLCTNYNLQQEPTAGAWAFADGSSSKEAGALGSDSRVGARTSARHRLQFNMTKCNARSYPVADNDNGRNETAARPSSGAAPWGTVAASPAASTRWAVEARARLPCSEEGLVPEDPPAASLGAAALGSTS